MLTVISRWISKWKDAPSDVNTAEHKDDSDISATEDMTGVEMDA